MKSTRLITSLGMLGLVSAQTSVVSLFLGTAIGPRDLVGSIAGNVSPSSFSPEGDNIQTADGKQDATATTYSITCPKPTATEYSDCGLGPGLVVTEGPKTAAYTIVDLADDLFVSLGCSLDGTTFANCSGTMGGSAANFPGKQAYTLKGSNAQFLPVTVTAGSVTSVTATATETGTGTTTAAQTASGATGTATDGSEMSTGGLPKVTGNTGIVAGGLAVAVAGAFV